MPERNLKPTILTLLKTHHLLSATGVTDQLEKQGKSYNKTSVYRSLEQLVESNEVCRHYFNDNEALYELQADHHVHMVCTCCGSVEATDCDYVQPEKVGSFAVDHHHLTFLGVCHACHTKAA